MALLIRWLVPFVALLLAEFLFPNQIGVTDLTAADFADGDGVTLFHVEADDAVLGMGLRTVDDGPVPELVLLGDGGEVVVISTSPAIMWMIDGISSETRGSTCGGSTFSSRISSV